MKKNDLKSGMFMILRCGDKCVVQEENKMFVDIKDGSYFNFYNTKDDLSNINCKDLDIIKVYEDYTCQKLLWQRKINTQLTEGEKVILRCIHKKWKWIARDKNHLLYVYETKPKKDESTWYNFYGMGDLWDFSHLFQFIKWEDEEPYCIKDLLEERD